MSLKKKISPAKMAEMVNPPNNMSLSKIGAMYNVSRQRVHQVLKEYKEREPELFIKPEDPSKEEIKNLLDKNMSISAIAKHFGITTGKVKKLMQKYNLKKVYIKDRLTRDKLYLHFVIERKSDREIAEKYNCSRNTVMKLRYINGITIDLRNSLKKKIS